MKHTRPKISTDNSNREPQTEPDDNSRDRSSEATNAGNQVPSRVQSIDYNLNSASSNIQPENSLASQPMLPLDFVNQIQLHNLQAFQNLLQLQQAHYDEQLRRLNWQLDSQAVLTSQALAILESASNKTSELLQNLVSKQHEGGPPSTDQRESTVMQAESKHDQTLKSTSAMLEPCILPKPTDIQAFTNESGGSAGTQYTRSQRVPSSAEASMFNHNIQSEIKVKSASYPGGDSELLDKLNCKLPPITSTCYTKNDGPLEPSIASVTNLQPPSLTPNKDLLTSSVLSHNQAVYPVQYQGYQTYQARSNSVPIINSAVPVPPSQLDSLNPQSVQAYDIQGRQQSYPTQYTACGQQTKVPILGVKESRYQAMLRRRKKLARRWNIIEPGGVSSKTAKVTASMNESKNKKLASKHKRYSSQSQVLPHLEKLTFPEEIEMDEEKSDSKNNEQKKQSGEMSKKSGSPPEPPDPSSGDEMDPTTEEDAQKQQKDSFLWNSPHHLSKLTVAAVGFFTCNASTVYKLAMEFHF